MWQRWTIVGTFVSAFLGAVGAQRTLLAGSDGINAGTTGAAVGAGGAQGEEPVRLAIVGPLASADRSRREALVKALGAVRPTAVLLTGDALPQPARDPASYAAAAKDLHAAFDHWPMPWYPAVGAREVIEDAAGAAGRAFQQHLGPLYYSADLRTVHVVVLDTEEPLPGGKAGISQEQAAWLQEDLNRTFDRGRARQVVVVAHRALWDQPAGDAGWRAVQEALRAFNRKPIVSVEGMGGGVTSFDGEMGGVSGMRGPRVVGVFAGTGPEGTGEYRWEPARDGVAYAVLGPALGEHAVAAPAGRSVALVTLDASAGGMSVGLLALEGRPGIATVQPGDAITAEERQMAERVETLARQGLALTVQWQARTVATGELHVQAKTDPTELLNGISQSSVKMQARLADISDDPHLRTEPSLGELLGTGVLQAGHWEMGAPPKGDASSMPLSFPLRTFPLHWAGGLANLHPPAVDLSFQWRDARNRSWEVHITRDAAWQATRSAADPP
jgi:hypothetical protein